MERPKAVGNRKACNNRLAIQNIQQAVSNAKLAFSIVACSVHLIVVFHLFTDSIWPCDVAPYQQDETNRLHGSVALESSIPAKQIMCFG